MINLVAIIRPLDTCNLNCKYCYERVNKSNLMSDTTLKNVIYKLVSFSDSIEFTFHGGEPLLAGLDFYKKVIKIQKDAINSAQGKINIKNKIQTNGVLLDQKYLNFFKENKFKISVSIDGPKEIHNTYRTYPNGNGTFNDVVKSVKLLKDNDFKVGSIGVLTKKSIDKIEEIYRFLKENDLDARLNPCIREGKENENPNICLTPSECGHLFIKLFDLWFNDNKEHYIKLQNHYSIVESMFTGHNSVCVFSDCFKNRSFISIDSEGDIYPCNRFVGLQEFNLGNINDSVSLEDVFNSKKYKNMARRSDILKKSECNNCKWWEICMGGCPHDAYVITGSIFNKSYYCESKKMLFEHIFNCLIDNINKSKGDHIEKQITKYLSTDFRGF